MKRAFIIAIAGLLVLASCDRTRSSTGWDYMPDMYYSNAAETYTPNEGFGDGMVMRIPVEGSIPRDMIPFPYDNSLEDRERAGIELINPLELTPENLARGKEAYEIWCMTCHGEQGDGNGYLYETQRYPYPPAALNNETVAKLPDGSIYHTITAGYGVMGAHGAMIRQEDRWKIIQYIREELQQ